MAGQMTVALLKTLGQTQSLFIWVPVNSMVLKHGKNKWWPRVGRFRYRFFRVTLYEAGCPEKVQARCPSHLLSGWTCVSKENPIVAALHLEGRQMEVKSNMSGSVGGDVIGKSRQPTQRGRVHHQMLPYGLEKSCTMLHHERL